MSNGAKSCEGISSPFHQLVSVTIFPIARTENKFSITLTWGQNICSPIGRPHPDGVPAAAEVGACLGNFAIPGNPRNNFQTHSYCIIIQVLSPVRCEILVSYECCDSVCSIRRAVCAVDFR